MTRRPRYLLPTGHAVPLAASCPVETFAGRIGAVQFLA